MAYNLRTGLVGSGDIDINVNLSGLAEANIPDLSATKITSGTFGAARVPNLEALNGAVTDAQIPDLQSLSGTLTASQLPNLESMNGAVTDIQVPDLQSLSGTLTASQLPNLEALNGAVTDSQVPNLQSLSGTLTASQLPNLESLNGAITAAKIATGAVEVTKLANDCVTAAKIVQNAVGSSEIATAAVGSDEIADGAVTGDELATNAVSEIKILNDAVTSDKIATGAVGSDELATDAVSENTIVNGAVTTNKIANLAVTSSQLAAGAVTSVKLAEGLMQLPGYHVSPGTYRKVHVLPNQFVHDTSETTTGTITAGAASSTTLFGGVKFTYDANAYISVPSGYKIISFWLSVFDESNSYQNYPPPYPDATVKAYKIEMNNNTSRTLLSVSANTVYANQEFTLGSSYQVTFDEESFLYLRIEHSGSTPVTTIGGWVKIEAT